MTMMEAMNVAGEIHVLYWDRQNNVVGIYLLM
jgi:hypothetical protein